MMSETKEPTFPLSLTRAQRKVVAGLLPNLRPRLVLHAANPRTLQFTLDEIKEIARVCRKAGPKAANGMQRNSLRHVVDAAKTALDKYGKSKIHRIPATEQLYQFKITLLGILPLIWRRIQVKNCSLDRLHTHIQTAMGWTNSHLHQFKIDGALHGDPELLLEGFLDDPDIINSLETQISKIVPEEGKRFAFEYEYDFGDCWVHEIMFEGCLQAEKGTRYPLCLEGERACPPEDVGGTCGYQEYLETLSDPDHEQWDETSEWRGPWRPEQFDPGVATRKMRRGLPNWRNEY